MHTTQRLEIPIHHLGSCSPGASLRIYWVRSDKNNQSAFTSVAPNAMVPRESSEQISHLPPWYDSHYYSTGNISDTKGANFNFQFMLFFLTSKTEGLGKADSTCFLCIFSHLCTYSSSREIRWNRNCHYFNSYIKIHYYLQKQWFLSVDWVQEMDFQHHQSC